MAARWGESRIIRFISRALLLDSRIQSNGVITREFISLSVNPLDSANTSKRTFCLYLLNEIEPLNFLNLAPWLLFVMQAPKPLKSCKALCRDTLQSLKIVIVVQFSRFLIRTFC